MARVATKPIMISAGVTIAINEANISVKGPKGTMTLPCVTAVKVTQEGNQLLFTPKEGVENVIALTGTVRALLRNMMAGVTQGCERKLNLVGVGFKAQLQGKTLVLALGYSHPIRYAIPAGITIETPSQTEVIVRGIDKHLVGQVAAEIRSFRPPEPYKGKGVRYDGELIVKKEGKKK